MHRLNFQLNSGTRFFSHLKRPKSTRDLLHQMIGNRQEQQKALLAKQAKFGIKRSTLPISSCRPFDQKLTNPVPEGAPIKYMDFVISTTCPAPWVWIAYFGRVDGRPLFIDETSHVFAETRPHQARVLALSDAMLSIDQLVEAEAGSSSQPETLI